MFLLQYNKLKKLRKKKSDMTKVINGMKINNMPWEEKPADCSEVFWRSSLNPILTKKAVPYANSIMNSAAVPFEDGFAGVIQNRRHNMLAEYVCRFFKGRYQLEYR